MSQSTSRFRPPGFLRHSPVDAFEQITHLPGADRDDAIRRRRPDEAAAFKPLGEQAHALTVMPDHLDQVTAAAPKNEEMAAVWVLPQNFLDLECQAGPALAHIRMARGQPYPRARAPGARSPAQHRQPPPQGFGIDMAVNTQTLAARQLDLHHA